MKTNAWCWRALAVCVVLSLAGCSHEGADWKSATAADTTEAYQQFLTQHPKSTDAAQAHARIQQLQEEKDWQAATTADTRDAYEQFLAQHADSKWAQEARIRIENFAQSSTATANSAASAGTATPGAAAATPGATVGEPSGKAAKTAGKTSARATSAKAAHAGGQSTRTASMGGAQYVQLGAFSSQVRAQSQWKLLSARYAKELGSLTPRFVPGTTRSGHIVRLQVHVSSRTAAEGLCAKLRKHAQSCVPLRTT